MTDDFDTKLMNEYLAQEPTVENSREIVKVLSQTHSMKESKVRAALVRKQVYIAQPRRGAVATPQQAQAIKARLSSIPEGEYRDTSAIGFEFDLTYAAVRLIEQEWYNEKWDAEKAVADAEYERENTPSLIGQIFRLLDASAKSTGGCMVWLATAGCFIFAIWLLFALAIAILQSSG